MAARWLAKLCRNLVGLATVICLQTALGTELPQQQPDASGVWWVNDSAEQEPLQAAVRWCLDRSEKLDVQAVSQGACDLVPAQQADLSRGFISGAMWLRLQLGNPKAQALVSWLVVGHPRLQDVTLWLPGSAQNTTTQWQALKSGTNTPRRERAVAASYPVFPVTLAAHSVQTVYLRVASQTDLDASVTLWQPQAFDMRQGRLDLLHDLALGGLLLASLFAMMLFVTQRDRVYVYFSLSMVGELVLEGCQSGLLADHFWPSDQPFPVELIAFGFGMSTLFLTLFALQYLGPLTRHRWVVACVKSALGVFVLSELWAFLVDFRMGSQIGVISLQVLMIAAFVLLVMRYRQGQRRAIFLLLAMTPSALVQALNFSLSMGWLPMRAGYPLAAPLSLLTMTPLLLLSLMQRSRELHTKLMLSQAINQTRTAFLAQISHDLRAPLNAVLGYARALTRPNSKLSTGDAALAIDHAGQRLLALIDEILDFAQGQANKLKLDPAPVHWATLVQDLSHYGTELAAQNGNRFVLKSGAVHSEGSHRGLVTDVLLDERRLRHVLDNLLSNASHYTAGGTVTLSCQADLLPGQIASLCFVVSDTGIGIAPEEKESVFEPFVRGASALRGGVKGTGLGLAIARQITQLMGGSLSLESQLGSGSRFTLNLSCPNLAPPNPLTQHSSFAELPLRCTTAPPDLVDLKELVYQGAVTDILHWAETLAKQQPAHAYFAAQVRQAALAVDFSTLRGLISAADLHAPS